MLFFQRIAIGISIFTLFFLAFPARAAVCFYESTTGLTCEAIQVGESDTGSPETIELEDFISLCKAKCDLFDACKKSQRYFITQDNTCPPAPIQLQNPIAISQTAGGSPDIPTFIGTIISRSLGVVGALTLLVFVYGGFQWLTSAGNEEKVKSGAHTMLYAGVGLFIIFASYGILNLVITGLTGG